MRLVLDPPRLCGASGAFRSLLSGKARSPCRTALDAASAPRLNGVRVALLVLGQRRILPRGEAYDARRYTVRITVHGRSLGVTVSQQPIDIATVP